MPGPAQRVLYRDWMLQNCSILVFMGETTLLADSLVPPQDVLANYPARLLSNWGYGKFRMSLVYNVLVPIIQFCF